MACRAPHLRKKDVKDDTGEMIFLHTFRKRQSSLIGAPRFPGCWGQALPNVVAFLSADERLLMATGALNLNSPTGGSAKGIPSHFSTSPFEVDDPRKVPVCKWMSKSWAVLEPRLSKRAEKTPGNHGQLSEKGPKSRSEGIVSEERPFIGGWWEIEGNLKKPLFLIRGIGLTVEVPWWQSKCIWITPGSPNLFWNSSVKAGSSPIF